MFQDYVSLCFAFFHSVDICLSISDLESFTVHVGKQTLFMPRQTFKRDQMKYVLGMDVSFTSYEWS